jgi:hypothetical protein
VCRVYYDTPQGWQVSELRERRVSAAGNQVKEGHDDRRIQEKSGKQAVPEEERTGITRLRVGRWSGRRGGRRAANQNENVESLDMHTACTDERTDTEWGRRDSDTGAGPLTFVVYCFPVPRNWPSRKPSRQNLVWMVFRGFSVVAKMRLFLFAWNAGRIETRWVEEF